MKHKKIIVLITAIVLAISSLAIYGKALLFNPIKGEARTLLSFDYEGVDKGLNPHGGTFEILQVKNDNVLSKTIEELGLEEKGITKEVLGKHIKLKGDVPRDVMNRILPQEAQTGSNALQSVEGIGYHPTQYHVNLVNTKELGLSKKEAVQVIDTLIKYYTEDFTQRYKDTQVLVSASAAVDAERYDYSEYIGLVEGQLDIMYQYLLGKEKTARNFVATSTQMGFRDLLARIERLKDIEITNVNALIDTFTITRNRRELVSIYENRMNKLQREQQQLSKRREALATALKDYEKDPAILLEDGTLVSGTIKNGQTNNGVPLHDQLTSDYIRTETEYNNTIYQIRAHQELLDKIKDAEQYNTLAQVYKQEVEKNINKIQEEVDDITKLTMETVDEYFEEEMYKDSVRRIAPITYQTGFRKGFIKNTFFVMVATGLGLIVGLIIALFKEVKAPKH